MISGLTIEDLAITRGDRLLFENLSLRLTLGEAVALTGANGAGKTSLLRCVAGFIRPVAGEVRFEGADADDARRGALHFLGHQDGLKGGRTARDELTFQVRWTGGAEADIGRVVELLGLTPLLDLEVRKLSAGQRRRLALARLIASKRPLWLLDEPMAPLDTARRALFGELMARHVADGGMILAAVHDPLPIQARVQEVGGVRALLGRELSLAWGKSGGALLALGFYAGIAVMLPLSVGVEGERLKAVAVGTAWVALALSTLLSLERLFERDYEDGGLDLLALGGPPLEAVCFIKCFAQWLATGAPLALAAPIVSIGLGAPAENGPLIAAIALLGSLGFSFTGGIGAALSLGSKRGGILIAILVLPLFTPPVIFGAAAMDSYAAGLPWIGAVAFLGAYSLAAVALGPIAMAAAVRNALS